MFKKIIKSKTMIFAALLSMLGALQAGIGAFTAYFSPQSVGVATTIIGIVVALLRVVTTQGLSDK